MAAELEPTWLTPLLGLQKMRSLEVNMEDAKGALETISNDRRLE
jgi:hypothetical protein